MLSTKVRKKHTGFVVGIFQFSHKKMGPESVVNLNVFFGNISFFQFKIVYQMHLCTCESCTIISEKLHHILSVLYFRFREM